MAQTNALRAYRDTRIKTASQGQLIIMLYDGAIKNLEHSLELMRANSVVKRDPSKIEETGKAVLKAQEIVTELMVSLDFEAGGEIAKNLFALYTWFNKELLEAHVESNEKRIRVVCNMLCDLRKTWAETVASQSAAVNGGSAASGLNIAG
ncbi:flagellar protein FliS [Spirochaetia bacterium]|nr:flagellar protein FliS [Spirochaetia bacterium]GHV19485.1 flagellar protein FliS [Spirochaetia bacterium]